MKRLALIAAVFAVSACNSAAKEKARTDSIAADSVARAAAEKARADSIAAAAKAPAKAKTR